MMLVWRATREASLSRPETFRLRLMWSSSIALSQCLKPHPMARKRRNLGKRSTRDLSGASILLRFEVSRLRSNRSRRESVGFHGLNVGCVPTSHSGLRYPSDMRLCRMDLLRPVMSDPSAQHHLFTERHTTLDLSADTRTDGCGPLLCGVSCQKTVCVFYGGLASSILWAYTALND